MEAGGRRARRWVVELSVWLGAATACLAGGVFPWINAELAVIAAAVVLPEAYFPLLVGSCAAGQMAAKCGVYGLARWAPHRLPGRGRKLLARAERYRDRRRILGLAVFSGALVAVPPFYVMTLVCGVLRLPFVVFLVAGLAGTAARYGILTCIARSVPL